jgi:hypothetical protein
MVPEVSSHSDCQDMQSISDVADEPSTELLNEIAQLRAENEKLRSKHCFLEQQSQEEMMRRALCQAELIGDALDDPSEPPPFEYRYKMTSPSGSTGVPSDFGFGSGCATPLSLTSGPCSMSGTATPTSSASQIGKMCTMVPVWFTMGDPCAIPSGVVQQNRAVFEGNKDLPSQLLRPAMSCPGEVRLC